MDPTQTSEDFVSYMYMYNLDSFIKGYHVYQEVWSSELLEKQNAEPEPSNVVDKYVVCVQRSCWAFNERQIRPFCQDNFLFLTCR